MRQCCPLLEDLSGDSLKLKQVRPFNQQRGEGGAGHVLQ